MISKVSSSIRIPEVGEPEIANVFLNVLNLCLGTICSLERLVRFLLIRIRNINLNEK